MTNQGPHIIFPVNGMQIQLGPLDLDSPGRAKYLGGTILSPVDLREDADDPATKAALDTLESVILAHAVAGVDILDAAYVEGVETTLDAIALNLT